MKPLAGQHPATAPFPSPSDALSALLPILDAFNHRHHNQHRASHWWPVFRITRRAVGSLSRDLRRSSRLDSSSSSSSPPPPPPPPPPKSAYWLDAHVVPRAYIAFTQLSADNQHAPLGILLLAILARIHAVLTQLLPDKPAPSSQLLSNPLRPKTSTEAAQPADKHVISSMDRGVAVSRHEIETQQQQQQEHLASRKTQHDERQKAAVVGSEDEQVIQREDENKKKKEEKKLKKKKKPKGDELSGLFASLT